MRELELDLVPEPIPRTLDETIDERRTRYLRNLKIVRVQATNRTKISRRIKENPEKSSLSSGNNIGAARAVPSDTNTF